MNFNGFRLKHSWLIRGTIPKYLSRSTKENNESLSRDSQCHGRIRTEHLSGAVVEIYRRNKLFGITIITEVCTVMAVCVIIEIIKEFFLYPMYQICTYNT
jgi:hypothetical protein